MGVIKLPNTLDSNEAINIRTKENNKQLKKLNTMKARLIKLELEENKQNGTAYYAATYRTIEDEPKTFIRFLDYMDRDFKSIIEIEESITLEQKKIINNLKN